MTITKDCHNRTIKITSKGVFGKAYGKYYQMTCHAEGCLEWANNLYWNEVVLCEKHYQLAKQDVPFV